MTLLTSRPGYRCTYICILLPASLEPPIYQGDLDRYGRASQCISRTQPSIVQADPVLSQVLLGGCQSPRIARIKCSRTMRPQSETLVSIVRTSMPNVCGSHQLLLHREQIVHAGASSALNPHGYQEDLTTDIEVTPLQASYTSSSNFESCTSAGSCTLHA
jgi:hypothetical protein